MANGNANQRAKFLVFTERFFSPRVDAIKLSGSRGGMTAAADRYKQYAAECLRIAQQATDPNQKARLLEMAEAWQRLSESAGKRNE